MNSIDVEIVRRTRDVLEVLFSMGRGAAAAGLETDGMECQSPPLRRAVAEGLRDDLLTLAEGKPPQRLIDSLGGRVPPPGPMPPPDWTMRVVLHDEASGRVRLTVTLTRKDAAP